MSHLSESIPCMIMLYISRLIIKFKHFFQDRRKTIKYECQLITNKQKMRMKNQIIGQHNAPAINGRCAIGYKEIERLLNPCVGAYL